MKPLKRRPPDPKWWKRAACRDLDPALWDLGAGNRTELRVAQAVCNVNCPVRLDCAQDALHVLQDESVIGPHSDVDVIRGGVRLKENHKRSQCVVCGLMLVLSDSAGICFPCRKYKPCKGDCGRGLPRKLETDLCNWCEKELGH